MIKLFRNIRKNLLNEGKTTKYFKYAIGEIVLVVIGILIALQINNWNESRKEHILEVQILNDIRKSLIADIENQLIPNIETLIQDLSNINNIEKMVERKMPYHDSLNSKYRSLMFSKSFKYEVTAYKNLENEGIQIIKNPEIKNSIIRLYNMTYPELENFTANFSENLISFFRPEMRLKFKFVYDTSDEAYYIPNNYETLLNDTVFMNTVLTAKINFHNIYGSSIDTKIDVENVIKMIDKELEDQ
jgi:uncharacterized membrane protein YgaE (UPF0421/DUF939 family)